MKRARLTPDWGSRGTIQDLDAWCGHARRYRDLVECGETWHRLAAAGVAPDNTPRSARTLEAMREICVTVLEPLEAALGKLEITYGFSSPALTAQIGARIAPELDQHAGYELRADGRAVCPRGGLAVDLRIANRGSRSVVAWLAEHVRFDRIYFYGDRRPVHVSVGPERSGAILEMRPTATGRLVPRRVVLANFLGRR